MYQDTSWKTLTVLNVVIWQSKDMGLILRDGIWVKEIAASSVDITSRLLDLYRRKLKDGSNLQNNFLKVIFCVTGLKSGQKFNQLLKRIFYYPCTIGKLSFDSFFYLVISGQLNQNNKLVSGFAAWIIFFRKVFDKAVSYHNKH